MKLHSNSVLGLQNNQLLTVSVFFPVSTQQQVVSPDRGLPEVFNRYYRPVSPYPLSSLPFVKTC